MVDAEIATIADWTVKRGLAGDDEISLLHGFCDRCVAAGISITRGLAIMDTLHPVYEGRVFFWNGDKPLETPMAQYGPSNVDGDDATNWVNSPFYHLLQSGEDEMHRRLDTIEKAEFTVMEELRLEGQTDWFAMVQRFDKEAAIGEMDCFMSRWTTNRKGGFSDSDLAGLRRLVPVLGLAIKSASLMRVAQSLAEAYLGRDPGRRVLEGRVSRGAAERINAVIWFSDMQGYTKLSESIESDQLIPFLNDYAEIVITSVHGAGGDVLKLMGDGVLAIFTADGSAEACAAALRAEADMRRKHAELNLRRVASGLPVSSVYLGLHTGDVFYGNIGSKDRLDFTVVGQAVNETSRIASMCRSADRDVLFSSDFRDALPSQDRERLVSVGRYALRGVGRAQELFTLDPEADK
ncbi:MAG: adenylate/guanylate cyclase domain-containing protein [Mesorhizobium sp.]|nr:adenylate/guanylate cyclase domain-containing protein [Mesorhizobium sp.]MBL8576919.1 adenylate/guanylate cyclase domain-containing protein [Mesorhizobium sp.]